MTPSAELDDFRGFDPGRHLLVWSWRLIVTGRSHCPLLAMGFEDACGRHAGEVFRAVCTFLCALACSRRRRLWVNHPGCPALTPDEMRMLAVVAAAQHGHRTAFEAHVDWIARRDAREPFEAAARALAAALDASRLYLPAPDCPRPAPARRYQAPLAPCTDPGCMAR